MSFVCLFYAEGFFSDSRMGAMFLYPVNDNLKHEWKIQIGPCVVGGVYFHYFVQIREKNIYKQSILSVDEDCGPSYFKFAVGLTEA